MTATTAPTVTNLDKLRLACAAREWLVAKRVEEAMLAAFRDTLPADGRPVRIHTGAVWLRRNGQAVEWLLGDWHEAGMADAACLEAFRWYDAAWYLTVAPAMALRDEMKRYGLTRLVLDGTTIVLGGHDCLDIERSDPRTLHIRGAA